MSYFSNQYGSALSSTTEASAPPLPPPPAMLRQKTVRRSRAASPSARKGTSVRAASLSQLVRSRIDALVKENGAVQELRRYNNGSIGVFLSNGKFRFISGGNNLSPRKKGSKMKFRQITKLSAQRALAKYYKNRSYKNDAARKSALTRDLCSRNKPVITDSRYLRKNGPANYDYPRVDDGSTCPPGHKIYRKKRVSPARKAELLRRLRKEVVEEPAALAVTRPRTVRNSQMGGGRVFTYADNSANRRLNRVGQSYVRSSRRNKRQIGGSINSEAPSISLKKAVKLLREYYKEKYNHSQVGGAAADGGVARVALRGVELVVDVRAVVAALLANNRGSHGNATKEDFVFQKQTLTWVDGNEGEEPLKGVGYNDLVVATNQPDQAVLPEWGWTEFLSSRTPEEKANLSQILETIMQIHQYERTPGMADSKLHDIWKAYIWAYITYIGDVRAKVLAEIIAKDERLGALERLDALELSAQAARDTIWPGHERENF